MATILSSSQGREQAAFRLDELAVLYRLTDSLYRARTQADVYDAALDSIVAAMGKRASVLLFDDSGVMRFVTWRGLSDAYRTTLEGHTPWKPGERGAKPVFVPDIRRSQEADWVKAAVLDEDIVALAFIPIMSGGRVIGKFMSYYGEAHDFTASEEQLAVTIARQLGFSLERLMAERARRRAEEDVRESEERFRLMSELAPVMIWTCDPQGHCLHLNRMLRSFWGLPDDVDLAAFDWQTTMHPDDAGAIGAAMLAAITGQKEVTIEGRYRNADGTYRFLKTEARPRFSPAGHFMGLIGVNVDTTDVRAAEEQREILLAELNHRVKNILAVVQAMAHQTFGRDGAGRDAMAAFEARLVALANSHASLTRSDWQDAPLHKLIADPMHAQGIDAQRVRITGAEFALPAKQALSLGLALHELFTNALKYGALSTDGGTVAITCMREGGRWRLLWEEMGGPAVAKPARRGFGSRMIERALTYDLAATVEFDFAPTGLVCRIDAPL